MATVPALTDRSDRQRWSGVRDEEGLWGDLRPELLEAVRTILETTMEDELAAELVAARYQRTPLAVGRPPVRTVAPAGGHSTGGAGCETLGARRSRPTGSPGSTSAHRPFGRSSSEGVASGEEGLSRS